MTGKEFIETRIRVEKGEDQKLYFIPEVLVLTTEIRNMEDEIIDDLYGNDPGYQEAIDLYSEVFGKSIEWCPIKKTKALHQDGVISSDRIPPEISLGIDKIGFRTLRGAKKVIDHFKKKMKGYFW